MIAIRNRYTLALALTLSLAGIGTAVAQSAAPAASAAPTPATAWHSADHGQFGHGRGGPFGHGAGFQQFGVLKTLNQLTRLYVESGRINELPALYNEILAKTKNPLLREEVYRRLARAQARPGNVDAAIATLRKSLDESLANEARFQNRHGVQADPSAPDNSNH